MPAATTISAISAVAGLAMSAMGAAQQAQAQRRQDLYRAQVARNNAQIARQNAAYIQKSGEVAKSERRELIKRHIGTVKAVYAANGFLVDDPDPDSTSAQSLAAVAEAGELDILRLDDRIKDEKRRALIQGEHFIAQAGLFELSGADRSGGIVGLGTLLSGAGETALKLKSAGFIE